MSNDRLVLVTGANGFIGGEMVLRLAKTGYRVLGIDVHPVATISHSRFTYRPTSLLHHDDVKAIIHEARPYAVLHFGAVIRTPTGPDPWSVYEQVNHFASARLFEQAFQTGARVVMASTIEVYGPTPAGVVISEDVHTPRPTSLYAKSKHLAEQALHAAATKQSLPYLVLRFAPVYAANERRDLDRRLYLRPPTIAYRFGNGEYRFSICSIHNVAAFISTWLAHESPPSGIYNLADATTYAANDLLTVEQRHGRARFVIPIPRAPARAAISVAEKILGTLGRPSWTLTRANFDKLFRSAIWDVRKATTFLGSIPFAAAETLYPDRDSRTVE